MAKIEIYTSNTCGYCHAAKDYFDERKIEYVEHNVSEDSTARKKLMKMGYMSVPIIVIDGEEILGFDKTRIEELLPL
ncbi:Glutaredoxin-like protein, YruB-family [Alkalithermobacter thermoalcaliphilus JW-YL-7 = DSM 7308]|uniref:Glutaredoxin n=1 Tax=Alkalithermobacter thermoalcaliphilus JW-YL-7 = DSM 7308 TaxID=1121328 RepID=A0A150FUS4_CLOPD|nr:glutaredoxin [[Clostridium] paradoxum JW-YL-7 = DSM 7308]SHL28183.1 Glutaredoxin-like protein, YruB-family [[Clostridium] paradoxum JW-YL-7 = DSM 7308]